MPKETKIRAGHALAVISDEWYVTEEGQDVTRKYIKSPPKKNTEPEVKKTAPSSLKKIFIGHGHDEQLTRAILHF
jgi:predicted nucleotide-binding protein